MQEQNAISGRAAVSARRNPFSKRDSGHPGNGRGVTCDFAVLTEGTGSKQTCARKSPAQENKRFREENRFFALQKKKNLI
ncbi:MAG: hypothetical protein J6X72_01940 [Clostridia bacterium]|nr:hypothetical protein [Clostridia bacterium]